MLYTAASEQLLETTREQVALCIPFKSSVFLFKISAVTVAQNSNVDNQQQQSTKSNNTSRIVIIHKLVQKQLQQNSSNEPFSCEEKDETQAQQPQYDHELLYEQPLTAALANTIVDFSNCGLTLVNAIACQRTYASPAFRVLCAESSNQSGCVTNFWYITVSFSKDHSAVSGT